MVPLVSPVILQLVAGAIAVQGANKDELLKGALFDVRGYNLPLAPKVIEESYAWGKKLLGL